VISRRRSAGAMAVSSATPRRSGFLELVLELIEPLGDIRARAMFGGYGVYLRH
jgi:hypothetical protein